MFTKRTLLLTRLVLIFAPDTSIETLAKAEITLAKKPSINDHDFYLAFSLAVPLPEPLDFVALSQYVVGSLKLRTKKSIFKQQLITVSPDEGARLIAVSRAAYFKFLASLLAIKKDPNKIVRSIMRAVN